MNTAQPQATSAASAPALTEPRKSATVVVAGETIVVQEMSWPTFTKVSPLLKKVFQDYSDSADLQMSTPAMILEAVPGVSEILAVGVQRDPTWLTSEDRYVPVQDVVDLLEAFLEVNADALKKTAQKVIGMAGRAVAAVNAQQKTQS